MHVNLRANVLPMVRLTELAKGQGGIIEKNDDSLAAVQLMEMGFIVGKPVVLEHVAPLGDPIAVRIAGYVLSIRKEDAATIWVSPGR